jgi:hypothetical protein
LDAGFAFALWEFGKGGREAAPTDIFYESRFFFKRGWTLLGFDLPQGTDCIEVLIEFLFGRALANPIRVSDLIIVEIPYFPCVLVADSNVIDL